MRKLLIGLSALAMAGSANAAVIVSFTQGVSPLPTSYSIIENFNSFADGQLIPGSTNTRAYANSVANVAARPAFNSTGNFAAALGGTPSSSYQVAFGAARGFSFILGSLDTFNSLTLLYSNGTQQIFNGAQIALGADADGNQVQPDSNGRVFYTAQAGDPSIVGARFASSGFSFEFDDLATLAAAPVPEPSTWAMVLIGFGVVGRSMRRRRQMSVASFG